MADDDDGAALEAATDEERWLEATEAEPADQAGDQGNDEGAEGDGDEDQGGDADEGSKEADVWATANPALKAQYEALQHKYNSANARLSPMSQKVNEVLAENERLKAAVNAPPPGESKEERLAALREDFPELAGALDGIVQEYDSKFQRLTAQQEQERIAATERVQAEIEQQHPGFMTLLGQHWDDFQGWLEDQPKRVRDAAARNMTGFVNASEVSEFVSGFKQHLNPGPRPKTSDPKRARSLAALASPPNRGRGALSAPVPVAGDEEAEWQRAVAADARQR